MFNENPSPGSPGTPKPFVSLGPVLFIVAASASDVHRAGVRAGRGRPALAARDRGADAGVGGGGEREDPRGRWSYARLDYEIVR